VLHGPSGGNDGGIEHGLVLAISSTFAAGRPLSERG
jgi:hypothetical protein